jgi:hypothetical protein
VPARARALARALPAARVLAACGLIGALPAAPAARAAGEAPAWSLPAVLSACPVAGAPLVVFPSDSPLHATGAGALVWENSRACPGGQRMHLAALGEGDLPGPARLPRSGGGRAFLLRGALVAGGGPLGQIVIAGSSAVRPGEAQLVQGSAAGPFSAPALGRAAAPPLALDSAYLGDVALASGAPGGAGAIAVSIERHGARRFNAAIAARAPGGGTVRGLTVALDYRSDAVAVWQQAGALYARDLPASGPPRSIQRLGSAGPEVHVAAMRSDDERAIVAWSDERAGVSSVYAVLTAPGVRFGVPTLLERFIDPEGMAAPAASPRLVRLRSESVMMAWAGAVAGHWVLRTAAVDLLGVRAINTISAAGGGDALLADLAPAPDGGALALWTEPRAGTQGAPDLARQALMAAHGFDLYPGLTRFGEPEQVAAPGPVGSAAVAFDPSDDRALAAWSGAGGALEFALRSPPPAP